MELPNKGTAVTASIYRTTGIMSFVFCIMFTRTSTSLKTYNMPSEACGYVIENGDQYKVTSRQIPHATDPSKTSYPANVSCSIIFRTDTGKKNFLRLSKFEVESSRFCAKDGLYLYDGGRENEDDILSANKQALCGTTLSLPNYFVTTGHEVTLKFVTDGTNNSYRGFTVLITPFEETDDCDGFTCLLTRRCITIDAACNQEYQCEDGSDEPDNCHMYGTGSQQSRSLIQMSLIHSSIVAFLWIFTDVRIIP